MLTVKMQDVELTPQLYNTPVQVRSRELSTPVMENLYNNINAYFHIVSIETDNDILGFEALSKVDMKKYFKYDVTFMINSINDNSPLRTGAPYCNILLQLTDQMITLDRTYTKLLEVLGDVGGLMEFVFSFLKILSLFLTEALYEKGLINHLFSFDLDKKVISVKPFKDIKSNNYLQNDQSIEPPEVYRPIKPFIKLSSVNTITNEETLRTKNVLNDDFNKNNVANDNLLLVGNPSIIKKKKKKKIKVKRAKTISSKITKSDIGEMNAIKSPSFNDNNSPNEIEITDNK